VGDRDGDGAVTPRDVLINRARQFIRKELTDLEQFVLIQILDQSWKDHLYAMDALKSSIGLQAFAEKDPRVLYKKEGYEFFRQMMVGVRDKVTDLIFRARVVGQAPQARSAYNVTSATHADTGGYGVSENLRQTADVGAPRRRRCWRRRGNAGGRGAGAG
jgi:preprotein translocase subunit SecA